MFKNFSRGSCCGAWPQIDQCMGAPPLLHIDRQVKVSFGPSFNSDPLSQVFLSSIQDQCYQDAYGQELAGHHQSSKILFRFGIPFGDSKVFVATAQTLSSFSIFYHDLLLTIVMTFALMGHHNDEHNDEINEKEQDVFDNDKNLSKETILYDLLKFKTKERKVTGIN